VPVSDISPVQTMEDVCINGFRVGHMGVSFHIGNIRLPGPLLDSRGARARGRGGRVLRQRGRPLPAGRVLYEFLLCRVGVGRSYLVESKAQIEALDLPAEYDSFLITHDSQDIRGDGEYPGVLPRHVLHHEYIVRDPTQALPVYVVHFEYDPEEEEKLALPLCDNCGIQASRVYCEADDANLCKVCDAKIHSVNSIAARHVRMDVNMRPGQFMGACPTHLDTEASEYCIECRVPLCKHCRSLGSHSSGEAAGHRIIGLFEAYRHELRSDGPRQNFMPTRQEIERRFLAELDSLLSAVLTAGQEAENEIYYRIQEAVRQGKDLAQEQNNLFLADVLEAKRQLDESAWIELFLEKVKALPEPDFMQAWLQHCKLREEVARLGALGRPRVSAGLQVEGGLRLVAADPI